MATEEAVHLLEEPDWFYLTELVGHVKAMVPSLPGHYEVLRPICADSLHPTCFHISFAGHSPVLFFPLPGVPLPFIFFLLGHMHFCKNYRTFPEKRGNYKYISEIIGCLESFPNGFLYIHLNLSRL